MSQIAILGGTFDPIHHGHLKLAKQAIQCLGMDEVWFMPTWSTPLKDRVLTDYTLRLKMIEAAIKPYRKMKMSTLEKMLPSPSYTIHTVEKLKQLHPEHTFFWIIGDDQYANFDQWKEIDQLKKLVQFICFSRNYTNLKKDPDVIFIEDFKVNVSSTKLRQGHFFQTVPVVRRLIFQYGLYIDEIVQQQMSKERYEHCVSVAKVAMQLAKQHRVSLHRAYLAGMLHDICKEMDREEAYHKMKICFPQHLDEHKNVWHQWLATDYLRNRLDFRDKQVLQAIQHHVKGDGHSKLAKILYIADKIDPLRGYDITSLLQLSLKDLNQGVALVRKQQLHYLKNKGEQK